MGVEDDEGEEAADGEPPAKKAKLRPAAAEKAPAAKEAAKKPVAAKAKASKKSSVTNTEPEIPPAVLAKAEKAGMAGTLSKLLSRDDVKAKGVTPKDALAALEGSNGLLHKARLALLGA